MPQPLPQEFPASPRKPAQRDAAFMIGTALFLIGLAAIFGVKSIRELSADEPHSLLAEAPRSSPIATRLPPVPVEEESAPEPAVPVAVVPTETAPSAPEVVSIPAPPAPPPVNTPQVAPPPVFPLTRVQPAAVSEPPAATVVTAASNPPTAADDAVLLDEVKTLERRGDEIMAERRTEDAFDLYSTALESAIEYAARKGASPAAKDHVVKLQRKLGLLQVQNASTAEARSSYQQARKTLLQLKAHGAWNRERAKSLDEMESRLLSLPRD